MKTLVRVMTLGLWPKSSRHKLRKAQERELRARAKSYR